VEKSEAVSLTMDRESWAGIHDLLLVAAINLEREGDPEHGRLAAPIGQVLGGEAQERARETREVLDM